MRTRGVLLALLLTACTGEPPGDDTGGDTADTGASPADFVTRVHGECAGLSPGTGGATPGTDLLKLTLDDANLDGQPVRCNDGSPPVAYVHTGTGAATDKWVFHTQGGGSCDAWQACTDRWTGDHHTYDCSKMSTVNTPDGLAGKGIFKQPDQQVTDNRFASWNHVFLYYCTSDLWIGDNPDPATLEGGDGDPAFSVYFQGHRVVAEALATLMSGASSDDGTQALPALSEAAEVLWTGSSAGGGGARYNADFARDTIADAHATGTFGFRLIVDAGNTPPREGDPTTWESLVKTRYDEAWAPLYAPFLDASCATAHPDAAWKCIDNGHVVAHHVTIPFFLREDLQDPANMSGPALEFAGAVHDTLSAFRDWPELSDPWAGTSEEGLPASQQPVGVFGPNCQSHVGLTDNRAFFVERVHHAGQDQAYTYYDLIENWIDGTAPMAAVEGVQRDSSGEVTAVDPSTCTQ